MKNSKAVSVNQDNKICKFKKTIIASIVASSFFPPATFADIETNYLNLIHQSTFFAPNHFSSSISAQEVAENFFINGGNGGDGGNGVGNNPGSSGTAGTGMPAGTEGGIGGVISGNGAFGDNGGEGGIGSADGGIGGLGAIKGGNGGGNVSGGGGGGGGGTDFLTGQGTGGGGGGGSDTNAGGGGGGGGGVGQTFLSSPVEIGENMGGNGGNGGNALLEGGAGGGGGGGSAVVFNTVVSNATNSFNNIGGDGGNGGSSLGGGGGGGGGGIGMLFNETVHLTNIGNVIGGNGGRGGIGSGNSVSNNTAGDAGSGGDAMDIFGCTQLTNIGNIIGGNGGDGGESFGGLSTAGNGGFGGYGLLFIGNSHVVNSSFIGGGNGGAGGDVVAEDSTPGNGGLGGIGIEAIGGGVLINSGTISGGNGGAGGSSATGASGLAGDGGIAIVGGDLNIINRGTIEGGFAGDHIGEELFRAPAIVFFGGVNRLELQPGFSISGIVVSCLCGDDVLALGGSGIDTFDVGLLSTGGQYLNFNNYEKTGTSTWTLVGSLLDPSIVTAWTINQGTLSISEDAQLGNNTGLLTLNGGVLQTTAPTTMDRLITLAAEGGTFETLADLNISGNIGGVGSLTKAGSETLVLSAVNTYTGPTIIANGMLALNAAGDLASSSGINLVNSGVVFDIENANDTRVIQSLAGVSGSLVNLGTTHLIINQANRTTFAGQFTGTEGFTKQGLGTLILTGLSPNYSGQVSVASGNLTVNGLLGGQMDVGVAGRLSGSGTVGTTQVAGTIAPGNSIGTLTVAGNYTQSAGSVYEVEINAAGQSDLINVTGVATLLAGAGVHVLKEAGLYTAGTRYTILTAAGNVNGAYSNLLQNLPFLNLILNYDTNNVYLDIIRNDNPFAFFGNTPNEIATATGVESLSAGNPLYDAFLNLDNVSLIQDTLNNLSGEIYASTLGALIEDSRYIRDAIFMRLDDQANFLPQVKTITGLTFWAHGFGAQGKLDGNYNASELERSTQGFFIGADQEVGIVGRVGLIGGYSRSSFDVDRRNSFSESDNGHLGIYANAFYNRFTLNVGAAYSWHDINTRRMINFPYFYNYLNNHYNANTAQLFGELGYDLQVNRFSIKPLMNAAYVDVSADGFNEYGGAASLRARQASQGITYTTLGIREKGVLYATDNYAFNQRLFLGWRHAYNDLTPQTTFNFVSGSLPFLISGTPIARNALLLDVGVDVARLANDLHLTVSYFGQYASRVKDNGVVARLTWSFDNPGSTQLK